MLFDRSVVSAEPVDEGSHKGEDEGSTKVQLRVKEGLIENETVLSEKFDHIFVATGYSRSVHEDVLRPLISCFQHGENYGRPQAERDYSIKFRDGIITKDAGIWLQGCCEESHGVSSMLVANAVPH